MGVPSAQKLNTKGAESWGFLLFLVDCMKGKRDRLGPEAGQLMEAGDALIALIELINSCGPRVEAAQIDQAFFYWKKCCLLTEGCEELLQPKRHLILHLLDQLCEKGNPRAYANWLDEGLNRLLRSACRQLSQDSFEAVLLINMEELLKSAPTGKIKRQRVREG